jgi:hypothetical protein
MIRTRLTYLLLVPLAFMLMGARNIPLVDPAPIAVPAGLSIKEVSAAVRMGLSKRNWIVAKDEAGKDGGKMEAVLNVRKHVLRIALKYNKSNVQMTYLSSENLLEEEKNGVKHVHKKVPQWLSNTSSDIASSLQVAAANKT